MWLMITFSIKPLLEIVTRIESPKRDMAIHDTTKQSKNLLLFIPTPALFCISACKRMRRDDVRGFKSMHNWSMNTISVFLVYIYFFGLTKCKRKFKFILSYLRTTLLHCMMSFDMAIHNPNGCLRSLTIEVHYDNHDTQHFIPNESLK